MGEELAFVKGLEDAEAVEEAAVRSLVCENEVGGIDGSTGG